MFLFVGPFLCSHFRAVEIFRYSLNPENRFIGIECHYGGILFFLDYLPGSCDSSSTEVFGVYNSQKSGQYRLTTSDTPPYCIGCS